MTFDENRIPANDVQSRGIVADELHVDEDVGRDAEVFAVKGRDGDEAWRRVGFFSLVDVSQSLDDLLVDFGGDFGWGGGRGGGGGER